MLSLVVRVRIVVLLRLLVTRPLISKPVIVPQLVIMALLNFYWLCRILASS